MAGVKVEFTGDWERLRHTINHLNTDFRMQAILLQRSQAERLKQAIEDKAFSLTGKPYDVRRPENTGVWWLETLELMENLEVKSVSGGDSAYFVGFDYGYHSHYPINHGQLLTYAEIAEKNEANHPLIAKVWEEMEPGFLREWNEFVLKAIYGGV